MTMIDPYGVGAGRAIAEQYEDAPEKVRKEGKRRETAAQIADRERLKARLQQRSVEYVESSQLHAAGEAAAEMDRSSRKSLKEASDRLTELLLNEEQHLEGVADATMSVGPEARSAAPKLERPDQRPLESLATRSDPVLLGGLLSEIRNSSGKLTRERALSNLDGLNASIRARHAQGLSTEDSDGILGYLDFLDGFFESGTKNAAQSEKMVALMSEIRIQLSLATDPGKASLHQQLALPAQTAEPGAGSRSVSRTTPSEHRAAVRAGKGRAAADGDDDPDRLEANQAIPAVTVPAAEAAGRTGAQDSASPQGRDSGRRREETLVSVTLRSV